MLLGYTVLGPAVGASLGVVAGAIVEAGRRRR